MARAYAQTAVALELMTAFLASLSGSDGLHWDRLQHRSV
jgi:hypothetical protein